MKRPLLSIALVFVGGILIGSRSSLVAEELIYVVIAFLGLFYLSYRSRFSQFCLLALVFVFGAFWYQRQTRVPSTDHVWIRLPLVEQSVDFRGIIISHPIEGSRNFENKNKLHTNFELHLEGVRTRERWKSASGKLLVFDRRTDGQQERLQYGDQIECSASIKPVVDARNPGVFNWEKWLSRKGIKFTARIGGGDTCRVLTHHLGNPIMEIALQTREHFQRALQVGFENESDFVGVLTGMVIGERTEISEDNYINFQRTGVFHVFAVSGLHVGLVAVIVILTLRLLRVPKRWAGLIAIPLLIIYVLATGARPGAVRALVMASIWLGSFSLVRPADMLNSLSAAALVILLWDPAQLFDGGFALSFSVVTALVLLTPVIQRQLEFCIRIDPFKPRAFAPWWYRYWEPLGKWCVRIVSGSTAAWIGLVPLMAAIFHLFAPISIFANIIVVPILGIIIAIGLLSVAVFPFLPWVTLTMNNANYFLVNVVLSTADFLESAPYGYWYVQAPPMWLIWTYYLGGVLLITNTISRTLKKWSVLVAVPVASVAMLFESGVEKTVEITILDLHHGAAIFIDLPGERNDTLIDGGTEQEGKREVVQFLQSKGVDCLGKILLTRGDKAHAAGLSTVAARIPIDHAIHSGLRTRSRYHTEWLKVMQSKQIPIQVVRAGDTISLDQSVIMSVIHPPHGSKVAQKSEENVLIITLDFGVTRVLLLSDAGQLAQSYAVDQAERVAPQIVVVGPNGPGLQPHTLASLSPDVLIIASPEGVGALPPDYPVPAIYRMNETGAVTIRLTMNGYTIEKFIPSMDGQESTSTQSFL